MNLENADAAVCSVIADLRGQLAAEQAAHQLTRETYATGAKMAAAVNESLRARIKDIADAVDRFLVALRRDQDDDTRETYDEVADAKLALAAAVAKREGAGSDVVAELRAVIAQLIDGHNSVMNANMAWENDKATIAMYVAAYEMDSLITRLAPEAAQDEPDEAAPITDDSILTMLSGIDTVAQEFQNTGWGVPVNMTPEVDAALCAVVHKWLQDTN